MKRKAKLIIASMLMTGILIFTGCSKSDKSRGISNRDSYTENKRASSNYNNSTDGAALDKEVKENNSTATDSQKVNQDTVQRKIITTLYRVIETKDFDYAMEVINERTVAVGGYIQDSNIKGSGVVKNNKKDLRSGELVVRIPADKVNEFIKDVDSVGTIISSKQDGEDITFQYYDTETRVKTLKIQEERLLSLLEKTDNLQNILDLEKRLSDIRIEIESLTTTLKKYDNLVSLATVNITIREVEEEQKIEEKSETFIGSVANSFTGSVKSLISFLKTLVILIAAILPFALVMLVIAIPAIVIYNKGKKKKENETLQK
ncbi:MAG: DUF4349 domain-containing protein [Clostridiales bacterium]|nr:DUF4349 domain-containing protein [Clostridiales bacterium]